MEKGFEGSPGELRELLDREAARFNSHDFIAADPYSFPAALTAWPTSR